MFFPERITLINQGDKVLEIGPGGLPHPRSDVFLELNIVDADMARAQRGFVPKPNLTKPIVYYDGHKFPFRDNEFDYIICSHVIEHVSREQLDLFISEMQRVARKGYIEFPTVFYELINYQPVHLYLMNFRGHKILFMDKQKFKSNNIHRIYREMFYGRDAYMKESFQKYKELFFSGFEWKDKIEYAFTESYDELVNDEDYNLFHNYFSRLEPYAEKDYARSLKRSLVNLLVKVKNKFRHSYINKTAEIEKKKLVKIHPTAEIKDYVIIKTYKNPVIIEEYSQINPFCVIYGGSGVYIGKNVMIAPHCMIAAGNHDFKQIDTPMRFAGSISKGPIRIEDNVWIGANSTICDGVTIGRDAVVAANSVIRTDVEPYSIVSGVPARVIGNRLKAT